MSRRLRCLLHGLAFSVGLAAAPAWAVNIGIDYTYDTTNFFGAGNPQGGAAAGAKAKAALEAAAGYLSDILNDTFSAIQTPPPFHSQVFDGEVIWTWSMNFSHPSVSGSTITLVDPTVSADEYRIYAGARSLSGDTLGRGGAGGYSWSSNPTGGFTSSEINQITQITDNFSDAVEMRGEPSGFGRWGGSLAFDRDGSTSWHYDHTIPVPVMTGKSDFYSVAIHELVHALGFGEMFPGAPVATWEGLVSGSTFLGPASQSEYGGPVPLSADNAHWDEDTMSVVYGTAIPQEAAMDPDLTTEARKKLTDLDAAGLTDIGWTVIAAPGLDGDYNGDGTINGADYTVWRDHLGETAPGYTLPNEGASTGVVNEADFTYWRAHFGESLGSGSGSLGGGPAPVPEPGTRFAAVLALAAVVLAPISRKKP